MQISILLHLKMRNLVLIFIQIIKNLLKRLRLSLGMEIASQPFLPPFPPSFSPSVLLSSLPPFPFSFFWQTLVKSPWIICRIGVIFRGREGFAYILVYTILKRTESHYYFSLLTPFCNLFFPLAESWLLLPTLLGHQPLSVPSPVKTSLQNALRIRACRDTTDGQCWMREALCQTPKSGF